MISSDSPCGACKFLRRKCIRDCVFAPYFCHEQGATHFAAIHKVFGASNVSKLLAHLPVSDRCEAAVTISYEAQARVQDPIYGCVSHIFALQQQVVNLQVQLARIKEQAAQCIINSSKYANSNDKRIYDESHSIPEDFQSWFQNQGTLPQFDANLYDKANMPYYENGNPCVKYENSSFPDENTSIDSIESLEMQSNIRQWSYQNDVDELQSLAFRYVQNS